MRIRPTYIRTRLTLWYIAISSLVIGLYISAACAIQYWDLNTQLYHAEVQDMETVEGLLYFDSTGHMLLNEQMPQEAMVNHYARRFRLPDGTHVLSVSHIHPVQGQRVLIRIAYSTEPLRLDTLEMLAILLLVLPLALVAAGFAGDRVAGKALTPLSAMARLSEQITATRLNSRVPVDNPDDELGHMARVLNGLLERLEDSFRKLQRFTSDVSHELRTPLASIRSVGEVGLQRSHSPEEYRDIIGSMLEEVARLTSMIETLLTISQADSGDLRLNRTVFPIMDLVEESVGVVSVLAEEKKQSIVVIGDHTLQVSADRGFLRMAIINLLDNAVKYSPPCTSIQVQLQLAHGEGTNSNELNLAIKDEGPGIPRAEADRVFDRFYRVDESRARETGGAGLGLAIAKWSIEAHGGKISLDSSSGNGSAFSIRLPLA